MIKINLKRFKTKIWYKAVVGTSIAGLTAILVLGSVKAAGFSARQAKDNADQRAMDASAESNQIQDKIYENGEDKESSVNTNGVRVSLAGTDASLDENGNVVDKEGRVICYANGSLGEGMSIDGSGNVVNDEGNIVYTAYASMDGAIKNLTDKSTYDDESPGSFQLGTALTLETMEADITRRILAEVNEKNQKVIQGASGKDGKDGKDGKNGEPGEKGERGQQGPAGQTGITGPQGEKGEDGEDGKDGRDGKTTYIKFSENPLTSNMSDAPTGKTKYIGTCTTDSQTAPTNPYSYKWVEYKDYVITYDESTNTLTITG